MNTITSNKGLVSEYQGPIHTIGYLILNVIEDMRELGVSMKDYTWLERVAARYYMMEYRVFEGKQLVSREMAVDHATKVWPFPADYIKYSKIAYNYNGQLWTLGVNNTMNIAEAPSPCVNTLESTVNDPTSIDRYPLGFWFVSPYTGYYNTMYASGGGFNVNYYRVNEEKRYIQFAEALPVGKAIIEYWSTGSDVNANTVVPIEFSTVFDNYLKWKLCVAKPKLSSYAAMYKDQYEWAKYNAVALSNAPTKDEVLDTIYRSSGFKIR